VHIFSGGNDTFAPGGFGFPEGNAMPGAPPSYKALWANPSQLMPFDITLLSCEGGETYKANPAALEAYLNAGGRAFASHLHYAFFSGPIDTRGQNTYTAPPDWGDKLADWISDDASGYIGGPPIGGIIDTTLNGSTTAFAKGQALSQWLKGVNALGTGGVPAPDLAIYKPRFNSVVVSADRPSQPWITADPSTIDGGAFLGGVGGMGTRGSPPGGTMYFSFDTPVGAKSFCGRAVFSDLHVAGSPMTNDTCNDINLGGGGQPPPAGCDATADLSPQEKALEFMLFDLSSCVIPDTVAPAPIPTRGPQ
jgi:hypothetical protein